MGESGCFLRAFWMIVGNTVLVLCLLMIALADRPLVSAASIGFWFVLGLVIYARYLEVSRYGGATSEGDRPATLLDVKRFGARQTVVSGAAWLVAHAV